MGSDNLCWKRDVVSDKTSSMNEKICEERKGGTMQLWTLKQRLEVVVIQHSTKFNLYKLKISYSPMTKAITLS